MIPARRTTGRARQSATHAAACLALLCSSACAAHRVGSAEALDPGSSYLARMKAQPAENRPPVNTAAQTVETWDPQLAAALADLTRNPTPTSHRQVAAEYRRLGIFDSAYAQFSQAIKLDPRDAAAYDGRARLWRDSGFPGAGLSDAYHALYLAPASAAAVNTLGTLLEAIGRLEEARGQYSRAHDLDPAATFAESNLCHIDTVLGRLDALAGCRRALNDKPDSTVAHNNLALAYAVAGDFTSASEEFSIGSDEAIAAYNLGIVYMAAGQFDNAAAAFRAAALSSPGFALARQRLKQADALLSR